MSGVLVDFWGEKSEEDQFSESGVLSNFLKNQMFAR